MSSSDPGPLGEALQESALAALHVLGSGRLRTPGDPGLCSLLAVWESSNCTHHKVHTKKPAPWEAVALDTFSISQLSFCCR